MVKENVSLDFILENKDKTRNFFLEEIKHNDLMNEKHKKNIVGLWITLSISLFLFLLSVI